MNHYWQRLVIFNVDIKVYIVNDHVLYDSELDHYVVKDVVGMHMQVVKLVRKEVFILRIDLRVITHTIISFHCSIVVQVDFVWVNVETVCAIQELVIFKL